MELSKTLLTGFLGRVLVRVLRWHWVHEADQDVVDRFWS